MGASAEVVAPTATVYVTNSAGHDYKKAEKFGTIRPVTKGYVSFQSLDRLKFQVAEAIADSKPSDYLLLSGTGIICVISAIVWWAKHSTVRLLIWDKKSDDYRLLTISQDNMAKVFEVLTEGSNG